METLRPLATRPALAAPPRIVDTLDAFAAAQERRKRRPGTIRTYRRELHAFARALGDGATVADVTPATVDAYHAAIGHLSASTIGKKLSAIRAWCRWCIRRGLRADDPTIDLEWPRRPRRLPRPLASDTLERLETLLAAPLTDLSRRARWTRNRDRRIVLLLLYGGFRRTEAAGLRWEDVDPRRRIAIVRTETAKGGSERAVPPHPRVVAELARTPREARVGAVAGRRDGRCLRGSSIGHLFDRWLGTLGVSAHQLRHTCATLMLEHGADIREVQSVLGHRDIRTTEGYLGLTDARKTAAVDGLPASFRAEQTPRRQVRRSGGARRPVKGAR